MKTTLTVRQIMDLGLWDKVCEYKGINPWALNEGLIAEDEVIEFDSEFKTDEELENRNNKCFCPNCGNKASYETLNYNKKFVFCANCDWSGDVYNL